MGIDRTEYSPGELFTATEFSRCFFADNSASLLSSNEHCPQSTESLFTKIERSGFLLEQIAIKSSFNEAVRTIEECALPEAVKRCGGGTDDWCRFLHYAMVGANLRGAAESLAEPEILRALVGRNKLELAWSIAEQLPHEGLRARALATVAGALDPERHREYDPLLARTCEVLDRLACSGSGLDAEGWRDTLVAVAKELALPLQHRWYDWLDRLGEDHAELRTDATLTLNLTLLTAAEPYDWWITRTAGQCPDAWIVADVLARHCAGSVARKGLLWVLQQLALVRPDLSDLAYWHAVVGAVAAATVTEPAHAPAAWQGMLVRERPPWTPALIERGSLLWQHLAEFQLQSLERTLDLTCKPVLQLCRFEIAPNIADWPGVEAALAALEPGRTQLHWATRAVLAGALRDVRAMRQPLARLTEQLELSRYDLQTKDLARFLDTVALVVPDNLGRQLENVLWSGWKDTKLLRSLVGCIRSRRLQELLFCRVEGYSAHVAGTDAAGFILRCELLTELTARLCVQDSDLRWLEVAIQRCARAELDQLKSHVAEALAGAGQLELARAVADGDERRGGIESYRLWLLTSLRIGADDMLLDELLAPGSLYRAAADPSAVEDETAVLTALSVKPLKPGEVADACFDGLHDATRRLLAYVDLAWHSLAYEHSLPANARDPGGALLPLRSALLALPSPELGAALVSEQVRLGAHQGLRATIGDMKECFTGLARRGPLSWERRYTAFTTLLATMVEVLTGKGGAFNADRCCAAASLFAWLLQLPGDDRDEDRLELREHWHQVLPFIVAAAERLPDRFWWFLRHPLLARIGIRPTETMLDLVGDQWKQRLLSWCDQRWPVKKGFRRLLLGRWNDVCETEVIDCWNWFAKTRSENKDPRSLSIALACLQGQAQRCRLAEQLIEDGEARPGLVAALATVLAPSTPELSIGLLRLLPMGHLRDRLCEQLLHGGWIDRRHLDDIVALIQDEETEHRISALCGHGERKRKALLELIASDQADPLDPLWSALRRRLWAESQETRDDLLKAIAEELVHALAAGGRRGGERALRWWLQVFFSPVPGEERPGWQGRSALVQKAIKRSLRAEPTTSLGSR